MTMVQIKEGEVTSRIYGLIKNHCYAETVEVLLNGMLYDYRQTRPMLSLLGFCYYQLQDFVSAADCYEELVSVNPDVEQYRLYFAQSLYKANLFEEAMKVSCQIDSPDFTYQVKQLQAAIKCGQDDLSGAKVLLDQCSASDPDVVVNLGCLLFKEGEYEEALQRFSLAAQLGPRKPQLIYNMALCQYKMKNYSDVFKLVAEIVRDGAKEHPYLGVGVRDVEAETKSVGNSMDLQQSALIEAFNLKMACYDTNKQINESRLALVQMPFRSEEDLDSVTLHNQALLNVEANPTDCVKKLQFLLQQEPCPPEAFANLLLVLVKHEYYAMAADILAENTHLAYKHLTQFLYDFLEAVIIRQTLPEESFRKLDAMMIKLLDSLNKGLKQVEAGKGVLDEELTRQGLLDYEEALAKYTVVLMQQAKIYWDLENYEQVEKLFQASYSLCCEEDVWRMNLGHVLFMQGNKFQDAINFYEIIVKKHYENLLDVSAIGLANLCLSYAVTGQMTEAEELIRKIEKEEMKQIYDQPEKASLHQCIVNLVLGTMYCTKGNYEFGILRIMHSLQPYSRKLGPETWYYIKRCFLSLIECLAKHMIMIKDEILQSCLYFLEDCELHGFGVTTLQQTPVTAAEDPMEAARQTVTCEARILKALMLQLK